MFKKLILTVFGVLLVAGALVGTKLEQFRAMGEAGAKMVPPPQVVTAAPARNDEWETTLSATGSLVAVQGVTVRAEVAGRIVRISFESGKAVEAGRVLVEMDTSTEKAQLQAAQAAAALARANLERAKELFAKKNMSPAERDAADAEYKERTAQVATIQSTIDKKTVRAPFSGRLGLRQVNLGEVLAVGDPITTLQTLAPIYVDFSLPQQWLGDLAPGNSVRVTTDAVAGEVYEGTISAVSPEVDPVTRNVRTRATIANRDEKLRAGMFANVEVVLPSREKVLAIPATAVLFAPYGDSVFVIEEHEAESGGKKEQTVRQRFVRLGTRRGDFVAVVEGLEAGEQVVSSGVFKLSSGMQVTIDNTYAPQAELAPRPGNI
jgi:membrane fusion protein (multidrug efflux system)